MKNIKPTIVLSTKIKSIIVIVKLHPYYKSVDDAGIEKMQMVNESEFHFPRKLKMRLPLHLNYDGYIYDNVNSVNALIVKNINAIAGQIKNKAKSDNVSAFDGIVFKILKIETEKEEEEALAEWVVV